MPRVWERGLLRSEAIMRCSKGVKRLGGVREYVLLNLPERAASSSSEGKQ